jgi:DNA-binding protein Fis
MLIQRPYKDKSNGDDLRLDSLEREHIEKVLKFTGGNKSKADKDLGDKQEKTYTVS